MQSMTKLILGACLLFAVWKFFTGPSEIQADVSHPLTYRTQIVGAAESGDRLPLLVVLHGSGADENDLDGAFAEFEEPIRIVSFRGPVRQGRGYTWAHGEGASPAEALAAQREMIRAVAHSIAIGADEVAERYPTVGKPMVFGFSFGASMAWFLAAYHPEHFGAIFAVAGRLDEDQVVDLKPIPRPPIFAYHGRSDSIVGLPGGKRTATRIEEVGARVAFMEFDGGHSVPPPVRSDIERQISNLYAH